MRGRGGNRDEWCAPIATAWRSEVMRDTEEFVFGFGTQGCSEHNTRDIFCGVSKPQCTYKSFEPQAQTNTHRHTRTHTLGRGMRLPVPPVL